MSQCRELTSLDAVRAELERLGFRVHSPAPGPHGMPTMWGPDLIADGPVGACAVVIKSILPYRRRDFLGALALAVLQVRRHSGKHGGRGIVAVELERVSERAETELRRLLADLTDGDVDWLLLDERGASVWSLAGSSGRQTGRPRSRRPACSDELAERLNAFTPGFQRLLKLLLLSDLPLHLATPAPRRPAHLSDLARLGGVVPSYASRFARDMKRLGYLDYARGRFTFRDTERLLRDWAAFLRSHRDPSTRAMPLYPVEGQDLHPMLAERLRAWHADGAAPRGAFAGHAAARALGLARTSVSSIDLVVRGDVEASLRALDLVPAEGAGPSVSIAVPRATDAVFASCVVVDGTPATDALQCYLDLQGRPGRGDEQARSIFEHALAPHLPGTL